MAAPLTLSDDAPWLGRRREKTSIRAAARPIGWPQAPKQRRAIVQTWYWVAAQIADSKTEYQVIVALQKWLDMRNGTCTATNRQIADWGGGMAEETASRAVTRLSNAGLFTVEISTRVNQAGEPRKTRTLRLAFPDPFPPGVSLPNDDDHLDHVYQDAPSSNTPNHLDHMYQPTGTRDQDYDKARGFKP